MVQDIAPKKLYNEYVFKKPGDGDYIAMFSKNKILVVEDESRMRLPKKRELPAGLFQNTAAAYEYLFRIDDDSYFLFMDFHLPETVGGGYRFAKPAEIREKSCHEFCFAVYTAYHLYQWYRDHVFCGRCGASVKPDKKERMLYCEKCKNQIYPRISPAVIIAVTDGDRILLSKYANREYKRYALLAGFAEIGETLEQAVSREVMEEVGLRVKNITYYKTQPWGIDGNLLTGYFAQLDGSAVIRIDREELAMAEWVRREELKDMDDNFSLTREMMRVFYEGYSIEK